MNKLNIETIKQDKVTIDVQDIAEGIKIVVAGDIDMQDPSTLLDPLFDKVHNGAVSSGFKIVELDVTQLNFLNSSGIKAIAKWIMKLATVDAGKKYLIKIIQNKAIAWQATSLQTLTFLVPGSVNVV
jgi:hypothetical protein|uniref:STAS domain-containing protein n=1 Tax=Gracilinema caldarium TaxID=215591 RepID=A0A7C3ELL9_9SPIR